MLIAEGVFLCFSIAKNNDKSFSHLLLDVVFIPFYCAFVKVAQWFIKKH